MNWLQNSGKLITMSSSFTSPRLAAKRKREEEQLDFKTKGIDYTLDPSLLIRYLMGIWSVDNLWKDIKIAEEQYNQRFTKEQIEKLEEYDLRHGFLRRI